MTGPKLTVYLVCRNHRRFVEQAIESVLRQSIDGWELLIIDDGSQDGTQELVAAYQSDPRIRLFTAGGIGLPAVCNLALKESRGEYIVRLDGDDYFDENFLLVLSNHLDRYPDVALVFPDYYLTDEFGNVELRTWRRRLYQDDHVLDTPPNGACTMVRRSVLKKLGGYREDLGAQDGLDLWVKLRQLYRSANINMPLFYYRRHSSNLTGNVHRIANARRRIKRDAVEAMPDRPRSITAVIPCRRRYDFVPDVWAQSVNGTPLLQSALRTCLDCELIDRIVVACDNQDAADIVNAVNDPRCTFFLRDPAETLRTHSLVPTIAAILGDDGQKREGLTVIRYAQAPFVTADTMSEAISTLLLNEADCSFGVEEVPGQVYRRTAHSFQAISQPGGIGFDGSVIYRDSHTVVCLRNRNIALGALLGPRTINFVNTPEESFFIDSPLKLDIAELMARKLRQGSLAGTQVPVLP
ncbi:glycosyltransferase [Azospirillum argentinense]